MKISIPNQTIICIFRTADCYFASIHHLTTVKMSEQPEEAEAVSSVIIISANKMNLEIFTKWIIFAILYFY